MVLGKLDSHVHKNETGSLFYTIPQNEHKMDQNLNVRPETIKLLQENTGSSLLDIDLGYHCFRFDTKSKGI